MYGLVKIANEQTINVNQSSREDRLLDEIEAAKSALIQAKSERNPEVVSKADSAFLKDTLIGTGIGGGIGAGAGFLNAHKAGSGRLGGTLLGGLAGAALGAIPGAVAGGIHYDNIIENEEDPQVLRKIRDAESSQESAQQRLEDHYLTRERILRAEEERLARRKELLGY